MITEGLLWFDDDPKRLTEDIVRRAIARFKQKHGHVPDVCYVHPSAAPKGDFVVDGVKVLQSPTVLPHHFWLGTTAPDPKRKTQPVAV